MWYLIIDGGSTSLCFEYPINSSPYPYVTKRIGPQRMNGSKPPSTIIWILYCKSMIRFAYSIESHRFTHYHKEHVYVYVHALIEYSRNICIYPRLKSLHTLIFLATQQKVSCHAMCACLCVVNFQPWWSFFYKYNPSRRGEEEEQSKRKYFFSIKRNGSCRWSLQLHGRI